MEINSGNLGDSATTKRLTAGDMENLDQKGFEAKHDSTKINPKSIEGSVPKFFLNSNRGSTLRRGKHVLKISSKWPVYELDWGKYIRKV